MTNSAWMTSIVAGSVTRVTTHLRRSERCAPSDAGGVPARLAQEVRAGTGIGWLAIRHPDRGHLWRLVAFAAAWALALLAVGIIVQHWPPGGDAHAYWGAWRLGLYGTRTAFGRADAYLYSPAFAAAIWPLTLLPWPAFYALWLALALASWAWLLWPVALPVRLPLLVACMVVSLPGNIEWLLALAVVASLRWPSASAVPLLTKVTLGIGAIWYAARGEWRQLGLALGTVAVAALLTAWLPWGEWLRFLLSQHGDGFVVGLSVPTWPRVILAGLLVAWGARTDRTWVLAVSLILASPDLWLATFAMLAALARLPAAGDPARDVGVTRPRARSWGSSRRA